MNNDYETLVNELLEVQNQLVATIEKCSIIEPKLSELKNELNHISELLKLDLSDEDIQALKLRSDEIDQTQRHLESEVSQLQKDTLFNFDTMAEIRDQLAKFEL